MREKGIIDLKKFRSCRKRNFVQMKSKKDIDSFIIVSPEKTNRHPMVLVVDFIRQILYPFFCGVRHDDGTQL